MTRRMGRAETRDDADSLGKEQTAEADTGSSQSNLSGLEIKIRFYTTGLKMDDKGMINGSHSGGKGQH